MTELVYVDHLNVFNDINKEERITLEELMDGAIHTMHKNRILPDSDEKIIPLRTFGLPITDINLGQESVEFKLTLTGVLSGCKYFYQVHAIRNDIDDFTFLIEPIDINNIPN